MKLWKQTASSDSKLQIYITAGKAPGIILFHTPLVRTLYKSMISDVRSLLDE